MATPPTVEIVQTGTAARIIANIGGAQYTAWLEPVTVELINTPPMCGYEPNTAIHLRTDAVRDTLVVSVIYCCTTTSEHIKIGRLNIADVAVLATRLLEALDTATRIQLAYAATQLVLRHVRLTNETLARLHTLVAATLLLTAMMYVAERLGADPRSYASIIYYQYLSLSNIRNVPQGVFNAATQLYQQFVEAVETSPSERISAIIHDIYRQERACTRVSYPAAHSAVWLVLAGVSMYPLTEAMGRVTDHVQYVLNTRDGVALVTTFTSRGSNTVAIEYPTPTVAPWIPEQPEAQLTLDELRAAICNSDAHQCDYREGMRMLIWLFNPNGVITRRLGWQIPEDTCINRVLLVGTPTYVRACAASCETCTGDRRRMEAVFRVLHDIECMARGCFVTVVGRNNNPVYVYADVEGADQETAKQVLRALVTQRVPNNTYVYAKASIEYECVRGVCAPVRYVPQHELQLQLTAFAGNRVRYSCSRGATDRIYTDVRGIPHDEQGRRLPLDRQCMYDFIAARLQQIEHVTNTHREVFGINHANTVTVSDNVAEFIREYGDEMLDGMLRRGKINTRQPRAITRVTAVDIQGELYTALEIAAEDMPPTEIARSYMYIACYRDWFWSILQPGEAPFGGARAEHIADTRFRCYLPTLHLRTLELRSIPITVAIEQNALSEWVQRLRESGYRVDVRNYTNHAVKITAYTSTAENTALVPLPMRWAT